MLLTLVLSACIRAPTLTALSPEPVVLGWKLVPGQELTYTLTTHWLRGEEGLHRVEQWTYLVREVDPDGVAQLEGRLTGLGATQTTSDGPPIAMSDDEFASERSRLAQSPITLRLAMDGRLGSLPQGDWADTLPHRLLGLQFPEHPIQPGDRWPNPALARPFSNFLPAETVREMGATVQFVGLFQGEALLAQFRSKGQITAETALAPLTLALDGESWWEPETGQLRERWIRGELRQGEDPVSGRLEIHLELSDP